MSTRQDRRRRAASRGAWPVRKSRLGEETGSDLRASTTAEERLGMMWGLARDAWSLTGDPVPDYDRAHTPVRRVPGDKPG